MQSEARIGAYVLGKKYKHELCIKRPDFHQYVMAPTLASFTFFEEKCRLTIDRGIPDRALRSVVAALVDVIFPHLHFS